MRERGRAARNCVLNVTHGACHDEKLDANLTGGDNTTEEQGEVWERGMNDRSAKGKAGTL